MERDSQSRPIFCAATATGVQEMTRSPTHSASPLADGDAVDRWTLSNSVVSALTHNDDLLRPRAAGRYLLREQLADDETGSGLNNLGEIGQWPRRRCRGHA
jgi:hypothetical protein